MKRGLYFGNIPSNLEQDDDGTPFTQVKNKSRKNKKGRFNAETAVQKDVSGTNGSNSSSYVAPTVTDAATNASTSDEVQSLKAEVNALKETVKRLSGELSFVLSKHGLTSDAKHGAVQSDFPPSFLSQLSASPAPAAAASSASATAQNITDTSYSSVIKSTIGQQDKHKPAVSTFKNDVAKELLSAVYVDLQQKKRRANNIIISGFPVAPVDREGAESFLRAEFHEVASSLRVISCRRLGRQEAGRFQPLLVVCSTTDDAQFILSNAKRLRKSNNSLVRDHIYINPDLTKAEASAAYEMRQRRRAAMNRNRNNQGKTVVDINSSSSSHPFNLDATPFHPAGSSVQDGSIEIDTENCLPAGDSNGPV